MKFVISTSSMRRMRLEAMQVVLAGFELDVPRLAGKPRAERMDALAAGFQQARHGVLRQPVDLEIRMQLAQLAGDGDVAPPMAEADRRGEIERRSSRLARGAAAACRRGDAEPAVEEIVDQRVALGRDSGPADCARRRRSSRARRR